MRINGVDFTKKEVILTVVSVPIILSILYIGYWKVAIAFCKFTLFISSLM